MSEPASSTVAAVPLITLAVALFGVNAGPYVVITLGAVGGSFWALTNSASISRVASLLMVARCLMTAIVLTAFVAGIVGHMFGIEVTEIYVVVAFVIAALGDKWLEIFESIKTRIQTAITSSGAKP